MTYWAIYAAYTPNPHVEVLDHAGDHDQARYLAGAYQQAYGPDWDVWCAECNEGDDNESEV